MSIKLLPGFLGSNCHSALCTINELIYKLNHCAGVNQSMANPRMEHTARVRSNISTLKLKTSVGS